MKKQQMLERKRRYTNNGDKRNKEQSGHHSSRRNSCNTNNPNDKLNNETKTSPLSPVIEDISTNSSSFTSIPTSSPSSSTLSCISSTSSYVDNNSSPSIDVDEDKELSTAIISNKHQVIQQQQTITNQALKASIIDPNSNNQKEFFGLGTEEFIQVFSSIIQEISNQGDKVPKEVQQGSTSFHTNNPPAISVLKYLERIVKFAFCTAECYILSLVYMDRLVQANPQFVISNYSIHRLLITSIMVAAKFFDDKFYDNAYYAKVGGIDVEEINRLEIEFLFMIQFSLHIQAPEFNQYKQEFVILPFIDRQRKVMEMNELEQRLRNVVVVTQESKITSNNISGNNLSQKGYYYNDSSNHMAGKGHYTNQFINESYGYAFSGNAVIK
ncbi:hypothetical protein ABK040_016440 [Willaertia magna]